MDAGLGASRDDSTSIADADPRAHTNRGYRDRDTDSDADAISSNPGSDAGFHAAPIDSQRDSAPLGHRNAIPCAVLIALVEPDSRDYRDSITDSVAYGLPFEQPPSLAISNRIRIRHPRGDPVRAYAGADRVSLCPQSRHNLRLVDQALFVR